MREVYEVEPDNIANWLDSYRAEHPGHVVMKVAHKPDCPAPHNSIAALLVVTNRGNEVIAAGGTDEESALAMKEEGARIGMVECTCSTIMIEIKK